METSGRRGPSASALYGSSDQTLDLADTLLAALTAQKINLRPGHSVTLKLHFITPSTVDDGAFYLIDSITSSTQPADTNASNDLATLTTI